MKELIPFLKDQKKLHKKYAYEVTLLSICNTFRLHSGIYFRSFFHNICSIKAGGHFSPWESWSSEKSRLRRLPILDAKQRIFLKNGRLCEVDFETISLWSLRNLLALKSIDFGFSHVSEFPRVVQKNGPSKVSRKKENPEKVPKEIILKSEIFSLNFSFFQILLQIKEYFSKVPSLCDIKIPKVSLVSLSLISRCLYDIYLF